MKKCFHHYQWHGGKLKCVRCGHRKWLTHGVKRNIRNISIFTVLVIVGFFVYEQYGNHAIQNSIQDIRIGDAQESVIKTITSTVSNSIKNPINNSITNTVTNTVTSTIDNLKPKPMDMNTIALDIHNGINEQRKDNGLLPLTWNPILSQAALNHSNDMAKRDYFEHNDPEGHDFTYRYSQVGFNCQIPVSDYEYSGGGENIMYLEGYYGEENIASQTVTGWMNSSGHRHNILTSYFQSEGIGVAESDDGKIYATEDFC
jgi:uncharacterized protein YkwD